MDPFPTVSGVSADAARRRRETRRPGPGVPDPHVQAPDPQFEPGEAPAVTDRADGLGPHDESGPGPDGGPKRRTGRNLPAAIGVGLALGVVVVASLFIRREAFVVFAAVTIVLAVWELSNALRARRVRIPLVPVVVGGVGMLASAYSSGLDALFVTLALTCTAVLWWRVFEGPDPVRDVTAGIFTAVYVPYLAAFAILMLAEDDGAFRVMVYLIVTVASDVGGYLVGSLFGRHVMAATVSPSKTWEGAAGSGGLAAIAGAIAVPLLLEGPWWAGVVLGIAVTAAATVGDLSESLLKRDLGIKDMGSLLPGHGGLMDRVDSLLPAAPVAYVLLTLLVP